ncbi:MAG: hypothetical protein IGR92_07850, partial [Leptolyngbyaceae cyanobacterium T60_A2020_046]|nr:hypothetical protein [Leptolyngbyaceae cyanobacterium T60_A2020_046]
MAIQRRLSRAMFLETEVVELRQICLTPGRIFEPGKYIAGELPDIAYEMGLVEKLPPVRGRSEELGDRDP